MENDAIIKLTYATPHCDHSFPQPIDLTLFNGENWIIYGPNGSGKTMLIDTIRSAYRLKQGSLEYHFNNKATQSTFNNISYVTFNDLYSSNVDTGSSAYQMRWNQGCMDEIFEPRVKDSLKKLESLPEDFRNMMLDKLGLSSMLDRTIISLSSGEFRRFQLAHILIKRPTVLIIDNPFIGLDTAGRDMVYNLLQTIAREENITLILILSRLPKSLKGFTHIIEVNKGIINKVKIDHATEGTYSPKNEETKHASETTTVTSNPIQVLNANNITIRYGKRTILKDFNLQICQGEHWALKGENGSGKSTLLSIICADNPQGYACDITLFGRKRGTGESIWDIKKNIGFVSPEMYRAFRRNLPVKDIVASGLFDTTGLFRQPKEEDYQKIQKWMIKFGIDSWSERSYMKLSSGEQRLVLLCRAFVKEPQLLILDEPFHGLDESYRKLSLNIINNYFKDPLKTLIMVSHYDEDFPSVIDHTITLKKIK